MTASLHMKGFVIVVPGRFKSRRLSSPISSRPVCLLASNDTPGLADDIIKQCSIDYEHVRACPAEVTSLRKNADRPVLIGVNFRNEKSTSEPFRTENDRGHDPGIEIPCLNIEG